MLGSHPSKEMSLCLFTEDFVRISLRERDICAKSSNDIDIKYLAFDRLDLILIDTFMPTQYFCESQRFEWLMIGADPHLMISDRLPRSMSSLEKFQRKPVTKIDLFHPQTRP